MRKLLLGMIAIILLAFSVYIAIYGVSLGGLEINSIPAIKEENAKLETKIQNATKLRNTDYAQKTSLLDKSYKKLISEKESYEQILALGVDENGQPLNKIQEYEVEKIWITMGNYAKKQGVDLKLDVTSNNSISKTYDLNFSVLGGYVQITDFLYDIERDATLVFKLENFKLVPGENTEVLLGTFTCKDVKLNVTESNSSSASTSKDKITTNDTKTNTTNTTGNTTGNTTNNSNTTNSTGNTTSNSNTTNSTKNTTNTTNSTSNTTNTSNTTTTN